MATLNIEGQNVQVDDSFLNLPHDQQQSTVDEIASSLKAKPQVGIGEDLASVAKAAPGRMVAGLAGLPADLAHMYATNPNDPNPLGSQALAKDMGSGYEAQRGPGSLLQTAGDFVPALVGGPESLAIKGLTRVVAPAVASEAAGNLLQGTPYETPARVASAFLGSYGASKAIRSLEEAQALKNAAIAPDALRSQTSTGYDALRDASVGKLLPQDATTNTLDSAEIQRLKNINDLSRPQLDRLQHTLNDPVELNRLPKDTIDHYQEQARLLKEGIAKNEREISLADMPGITPPSVLENVANTIRSDLNLKNQRPINAPELHSVLDQMTKPATAGKADVADLLAARTALKDNISTNPAGTKIALDSLDKAIERYSPGTIPQLKELDKNWTAVRSGEALDKNLAKAERSAAGANSGLNLGNRIRQRVDSFLGSNQAKFISDEMKTQLEKVNAGTATQNTLRDISNMLGKGHGLGGAVAGEIIGHIFGNDLLGLAVGTISGRATNALYTRSVVKSAKEAADAIRRESPAGKAFAQAPKGSKMTPAQFNSAIKVARIDYRKHAAIPAATVGISGVRSYSDKNR